jgi:TonB family protein
MPGNRRLIPAIVYFADADKIREGLCAHNLCLGVARDKIVTIVKLFDIAKCQRCGGRMPWPSRSRDLCPACEPEAEQLAGGLGGELDPEILEKESASAPFGEIAPLREYIDLSGILGSLQIQSASVPEYHPFSHVLLVHPKMPVRGLAYSLVGHAIIISLLLFVSALHLGTTTFHMTREMLEQNYTLTYYRPSDLLPLMSSPKPGPKDPAGERPQVKPSKGSTSYHPTQTTQSSPAKPDNPNQTVIQPKTPEIIKKDLKLPNIVVWNVEEPKTDMVKLAGKTATPLASMAMPAPQIKVQDSEVKNVDRSLAELNIKMDLINAQPKMMVQPGSSPEWAIGNESGKSDELINISGSPGDASLKNLVVLSANPSLPTLGGLRVPPGSRSGAFSISPEGNRAGSPDGVDEGSLGGGVPGGGGTGGTGSGAGGGRDIAQIRIPGLSVRGGGAQMPSPGVVGTVRPNFSEMVTIEEPAESYNITIVEGRSGGAGLGVYGVLTGKRNYTVFIPMPGGRWIMQFSEIPDPKENSASAASPNQATASQLTIGMGEAMTQPRPYRKVDPGRPEDEELAKLRGLTVLYAIIRKDGTIDMVRVVRSLNSALDDRAMEALKKWKFKPALLGANPIEVQALFGIPFKPQLTRP